LWSGITASSRRAHEFGAVHVIEGYYRTAVRADAGNCGRESGHCAFAESAELATGVRADRSATLFECSWATTHTRITVEVKHLRHLRTRDQYDSGVLFTEK
jgi:hypothetical protein